MKIEESEIIEVNDYRVIIYPASRPFATKEAKLISERIYEFLSTWAAHEKPLSSSFKIEKNQFVIICVDEEQEPASGCSIDALNGLFRELDHEFDLGFFDRMKACYLENNEVKTLKLSEFRAKLKSGEISDQIEVFDFSHPHYSAFIGGFLLPLKESWANIYLEK